MTRNFWTRGFREAAFCQKPVTAAFAAVTLLLSLASSPPALRKAILLPGSSNSSGRSSQATSRKPRPEFHRSAPREHLSRPRSSYPAAERAARRPTERAGEKAIAKEPGKPDVAPSFFRRGPWRQPRPDAGARTERGVREPAGGSRSFARRRKIRVLVRDDFFDWTKATQDLLASGEKIDYRSC